MQNTLEAKTTEIPYFQTENEESNNTRAYTSETNHTLRKL